MFKKILDAALNTGNTFSRWKHLLASLPTCRRHWAASWDTYQRKVECWPGWTSPPPASRTEPSGRGSSPPHPSHAPPAAAPAPETPPQGCSAPLNPLKTHIHCVKEYRYLENIELISIQLCTLWNFIYLCIFLINFSLSLWSCVCFWCQACSVRYARMKFWYSYMVWNKTNWLTLQTCVPTCWSLNTTFIHTWLHVLSTHRAGSSSSPQQMKAQATAVLIHPFFPLKPYQMFQEQWHKFDFALLN